MAKSIISADQLRTFLHANPDMDFATLDLLTTDGDLGLEWAGLDPESDRAALQTWQRLLEIHPDFDVVQKLADHGLESANHVARIPRKRFAALHAAGLGLDEGEALRLHRRATRIRNKTMHLWASVRATVASPFFRSARTDTVGDQVKNVFEDLPSYQELFGSLDHCICEECRSIFGPAAYLVDLLRIIDEYVTEPNQRTIPEALHFDKRRPDIAEIELTCANTTTLVPYLEVVNERLTATVQRKLPAGDVQRQMATTLVYPRRLPFNTPLDQVRVLLDKIGAPYGSILAAWKASAPTVAARSLGLSPEQQSIVTAPLTTADDIAPYYDVSADRIDGLSDADTFRSKTGLSFAGLLELVDQDLSSAERQAGLQRSFFINQGLGDRWVSLKQKTDGESYVLDNLELSALDRINRLLRLADAVGRAPQEVDWALRCVQGGGAPVITGGALALLFQVTELATSLALDWPDATALLGPIKTYGESPDGGGSPFDQLFNPPAMAARPYRPSGDPLNPLYTGQPLSWTPGSSSDADVAHINRVLPGLGLSLADANALGVYLYGSSPLELTVGVLSALYRHAVLSRALQLPMERYLVFLKLQVLQKPPTPSATELTGMVAASAWMQRSGLSVYQLDYVVTGTPSVYVDPMYRPDLVADWLRGLHTIVSEGSPEAGGEITAQVAVLFGASDSLMSAILRMAVIAVALPGGVTTWEQAFLAGLDHVDYVKEVLAWVSRWLVLARALSLPEATVASLAAGPAAYGVPATFDSIPLVAVENLDRVQRMMQSHGDLQRNLLRYVALAAAGDPGALDALRAATGWAPDQVRELLAGPVKDVEVLAERLIALQTCFGLIDALGADAGFMARVAALGDARAAQWDRYTETAGLVLAKAASRYGDRWATVWGPLSGELAVYQRDALLALVLALLNAEYPDVTTPRNVYEFLLTDVEMGAEARISVIKEALNAAQLYLQRCRLRLEPGVEDLSHVDEAWWEWMMNYRTWQANREIFVYPENYLVPSLLSPATPQFKTLVQALQQSDVTKPYMASVFQAYLDQFAVVAHLKPVDAYRAKVHDTHTLYLLARTQTTPHTFYHCSQREGMPWTPWTKIDLTIHAPRCTLVHAFDRLFLFWNEVKKTTDGAVAGDQGKVDTRHRTTYTVSVLYSFIDQQGSWVQPQTLVDQEAVFQTVDDEPPALAEQDVFDGAFDMTDPAWSKVFALSVKASNYVPAPKNEAQAERLVVMYGPFLQNTGKTIDPGPAPATTNPAAKAVWQCLHERAQDHDRMVQGQLSGNLPLRSACILDMSLEENVLVHQREILLLDPYQKDPSMALIRAEMQSTGTVLQIVHSGEPITDNELAGRGMGLVASSAATAVQGHSFLAVGISEHQSLAIYKALQGAGILDASGNVQAGKMATLDLDTVLAGVTAHDTFCPAQYPGVQRVLFEHLGGAELFTAVDALHTSIVPVGTQPGWYLFSTGNEVFLLTPRPVKPGTTLFSTFTEGLTVGAPLLKPRSFIMSYQGKTPGNIDAATSKQIFDVFVGFSLLEHGRMVPGTTEDDVELALGNLVLQKKIAKAQVGYVYNVLANTPFVYPDAFIGDKIDSQSSEKVYGTLEDFSLIDPNRRLDESVLTGTNVELALGNLLRNGTLTRSQIAGIYSKLVRTPKAVSLSYTNHGDATGRISPQDFQFDVVRLSTGAAGKLRRALLVGGIEELLSLETQEIPVVPVQPFDRLGPSATSLRWPTALDATQVDFDGLYGQYYWEIFYHVPMLVASSLAANQHFMAAQAWQQYVFDPTAAERFVKADTLVEETRQEISKPQADGIVQRLQSHEIGHPPRPILSSRGAVNPSFQATTDLSFLTADPSLSDEQVLMVRNILLNYQLHAPASHYWRFRPFRNHTLQTITEMLSDDHAAIKVYDDDPFAPFAIARLRIGAFEKATVMQYIDNLIAWGDQLFTQDTWESITAAYMLYVYAHDLLGPKPEAVGECPGAESKLTFAEIKRVYPHGIPQFLIDLEHFLRGTGDGPATPMLSHAFNDLDVYFCVPENADFVSRWDTVRDRLDKINHSMNIAGVARTLPLFQPPIDPLALVKAAAAGNNVVPVATHGPELSPFRFTSALASARALCGTVIELGSALLATLEKKDAEGLAVLRTHQEGQILEMITQIKEDRITELEATFAALTASRTGAADRLTFYQDLIAAGLSGYEQTSLSAAESALAFNLLGSISKTAATIAYAVPQVGSPFAMTYGGIQVGSAVNAAAGVFEIGAEIESFVAQRASTMGGYERRAQEWALQKDLAQHDVDGLEQNLASAQAQLAAARQDLAAHRVSIGLNQKIESFLETRFTGQELYQWMAGRLTSVYFQTYALALAAARQAEASYQFELDSSDTFLAFDDWDSLHKGLTAGEGLRLALDRLEAAYRKGDSRRLEVEKTVSLARIAPDQLLALKTEGSCSFSLTEALFDYDYPGQYARKIKTISISIPAVVGPYQNLKAILTQTKNSVVTAPRIDVVSYLLGLSRTRPAAGLREDWANHQSIAISRGVDDSGMFVLDFQDPRYLPFENTGAASDWKLEMPRETNRFDFEQLSDVIIKISYTARFDGTLQGQVKSKLSEAPYEGGLYLDSNWQSRAWQAFLEDRSNPEKQNLTLTVDPSQMGYFKSLTYKAVVVRLDLADGMTVADGAKFLELSVGSEPERTFTLSEATGKVDDLDWPGKALPTSWNFGFDLTNKDVKSLLTDGFIDGEKLLGMQVIVLYEANVF